MNKQQITNGYRKMRDNINSNKDHYLVKIHSAIKKYFKDIPKEKWSFTHFLSTTNIDDLIFKSLERTYSITTKAVEDLYNIKDSSSKVEVADLMYSKDGKTLYERLKDHFENACKHEDQSGYMFNRCVLIMDTETSCVSNGIIHGKINKHATHAEVIGNGECDDHPECEFWLSKGKIPIEELEELPPYHPDCECEVIYYIDEE